MQQQRVLQLAAVLLALARHEHADRRDLLAEQPAHDVDVVDRRVDDRHVLRVVAGHRSGCGARSGTISGAPIAPESMTSFSARYAAS